MSNRQDADSSGHRAGPWWWIRHLKSTDSTQDQIFRMTKALIQPPGGTVVVADKQTKGRGREGRSWLSPVGGLYCSVLLRDEDLLARAGQDRARADRLAATLPLVAGLAVADVVESFGAKAEIKWPNDVMILERKLAGILCERKTDAKGETFTAVGIGMNLVKSPLETAAYLEEIVPALQRPITRDNILRRFLDSFAARLDRSDTAAEVDKRLYGRGRTARHEEKKVVIRGVSPQGALLVNTEQGVTEIISGEIIID